MDVAWLEYAAMLFWQPEAVFLASLTEMLTAERFLSE